MVTYAVRKTQNVLRNRAVVAADNNGTTYDKLADPYRNFYEEIHFTSKLDVSMLSKLGQLVAGQGPDGEREGEEPNLKCADRE